MMAPSISQSERPLSSAEAPFKRHGQDFKQVEASRPDYDWARTTTYSKTPKPDWQPGDGATDRASPGGGAGSTVDHNKHNKISFEPYEPGRDLMLNYKLMITSVVPRPIALVSTISPDGKTRNLAPFSYFQAICSDVSGFHVSYLGDFCL